MIDTKNINQKFIIIYFMFSRADFFLLQQTVLRLLHQKIGKIWAKLFFFCYLKLYLRRKNIRLYICKNYTYLNY